MPRMNGVLYDGAQQHDDIAVAVADAVYAQLGRQGLNTRRFVLRDMNVGWCRGCLSCWVQTPGVCVLADDGRELAAAYVGADLVVFTSRIAFGGYAAQTKRALDRMLCHLSVKMRRYGTRVRHAARYARMPRMLAVGIAPLGKVEFELFQTVVAANGRSLHAPMTRAVAVHNTANVDALLPHALTELGVT
jgi:multimeric flavodoxin WrbA